MWPGYILGHTAAGNNRAPIKVGTSVAIKINVKWRISTSSKRPIRGSTFAKQRLALFDLTTHTSSIYRGPEPFLSDWGLTDDCHARRLAVVATAKIKDWTGVAVFVAVGFCFLVSRGRFGYCAEFEEWMWHSWEFFVLFYNRVFVSFLVINSSEVNWSMSYKK